MFLQKILGLWVEIDSNPRIHPKPLTTKVGLVLAGAHLGLHGRWGGWVVLQERCKRAPWRCAKKVFELLFINYFYLPLKKQLSIFVYVFECSLEISTLLHVCKEVNYRLI